MKKLFILLIMLTGLISPVFADENSELPSVTGIVENIQYEDVQGLQQGDNSVKQVVLIKVLSGEFKGTERLVDNMLTGNPAYDINLKRGDKVILHAEAKTGDITSADDVDFSLLILKEIMRYWEYLLYL